jgi:hypothetical protein
VFLNEVNVQWQENKTASGTRVIFLFTDTLFIVRPKRQLKTNGKQSKGAFIIVEQLAVSDILLGSVSSDTGKGGIVSFIHAIA